MNDIYCYEQVQLPYDWPIKRSTNALNRELL